MVADGYKDTEIGVIPVEWDVVRLEDVLQLRGGNAFKSSDFQISGIPILKISNITKSGNIDLSSSVKVKENEKYTPYLLKENDIVVAMSGATTGKMGQVKINNLPIYLNQRVGKFEIKKTKLLNNQYLYFNVTGSKFLDKLLVNAIGGAQPNISSKQIEELKIPLPPLKEQEKIADILSTADAKIDAIEGQIQKAETLKKGLLQKLLSEGIGHSKFKDSELGKIPESWEVVRLRACSELIKDGTHGTHKDVENGIPLLSAKDIKYGKVILDTDSRKISLDEFNKIHKNYSLNNDDLLLTVVGTLGRVALIKGYNNNYTFQRSVAIIRLLKTSYPKYFYHIFTSLFFQKQLILHSNASAQAGIYLGELEKLKIPLPPLKEQKQIAEILSTADEKLEVLRAKKEKYETLKKGLLQKLLSGEVRV